MLRPMIVIQNYFQGQDIAFLQSIILCSIKYALFYLKKHCNIPTLHGNWSWTLAEGQMRIFLFLVLHFLSSELFLSCELGWIFFPQVKYIYIFMCRTV